jgi:hypothetical protein
MSDINPSNPRGVWTVEQWASAYTVIGGRVELRGGPAAPDMDGETPYETNGNQFRWYDHPGPYSGNPNAGDAPLGSSYEGVFDFAVKVTNGTNQCEVRFHIYMRLSNGNWTYRWGGRN